MSKSLFVTGTGTDIGKTYVSALILKKLSENSIKSGYYKAIMSGNDRANDGSLIAGDAKFVKEFVDLKMEIDEMCPYIYENAYSPHLASRLEGNPINLDVVEGGYQKAYRQYDYLLVEGSGGIVCPIEYDNDKIWLVDIIKRLDLSCIIVADAGLGIINYVILTTAYMNSMGIKIKGIIFNNYEENNVMHKDNIKMCKEITNLKVLDCVSHNQKSLNVGVEEVSSWFE